MLNFEVMRYGGRQKGTPNAVTKDLRQIIHALVEKHLANDLELLEPTKRAELLIRLLPFILPTKKDSFDHTQSNEPLVITLQGFAIDDE
jgi:hypothetical protein